MDSLGVFDEVHPGSSDGEPDILDGLENAVGELAGLQKFEHAFHRVSLGAVGWQEEQGDAVWDRQFPGFVPSRAIEDDGGVAAGCDLLADVFQMSVHFGRVRSFADMSHAQLASRTSRREEVAIPEAPVAGDPGPCALACPDPGEHSLLADSTLVLHPDLDRPRCLARGFLCQLAEVVAEIVLRRKVGLGVKGTRRHVPEAQPQQQLPNPFRRVLDPENRFDPFHDIAQAKARGGFLLWLRTGLNPFPYRFLLLFRQPTPAATARQRTPTIHTSPMLQDHPVSHRLDTHALRAANLRSRDAAKHHRDRPHTSRPVLVLALTGKLLQCFRSVASVQDRLWEHPVVSSRLQFGLDLNTI